MSKKIILILIIAIIVLVISNIATISFLYLKQNNKIDNKKQEANIVPENKNEVIISDNQIKNSTAKADENFKSYINDQYGFLFKYPSKYIYRKFNYIEKISDENNSFEIRIIIDENFAENIDQKKALKLEAGRTAMPLINERYITINNNLAYRTMRQLKKGDGWDLSDGDIIDVTETEVQYTFQKDNNLIYLRFTITSENPENLINKFDSMISSFNYIKK